MSTNTGFAAGLDYLEDHGFVLVHVFDTVALPAALVALLDSLLGDARRYQRLVLAAHAGTRFWEALRASGVEGPDPVDSYSTTIMDTFVRRYLARPPSRLLYPSSLALPLQQLGALAGWSHPSPLGIGIHPRFGSWFAYRAAMLVAAPLPVSVVRREPSPCARCAEKPCVAACPVGAVRADNDFRLDACTSQRLEHESTCAPRCAARLACPVGAAHRYRTCQIAYHAERSLASIRRYAREADDTDARR